MSGFFGIETIDVKYVRDFIEENARILAVVSLPQQTFVPSGSGVKTSLLFLQKKRGGEDLGEYPIFMAIAEHVGYDATGRPDKNDFPKVLEDWGRFKDDKRDFSNAPLAFAVMRGELGNRHDPEYYHPDRINSIRSLSKSSYPLVNLEEVVNFRKSKLNPQQYSSKLFNYLSLANILSHTGEVIDFTQTEGKNILSSSNVFKRNDILFARLRPYLNKIYLAQGDIEEGICSTEFFVLKPSEEINPFFLQTFLLSSFVLNQTKHMMTGNTLPRVIREDVCNIKIPLLPRPIQDRFAEMMEEAYKQRKEKLKEAENLLAGINDFVLDKLGIKIPEVEEKKTFVVTLKDLKEGKRHDPFYCLPRFKELIKELEGRDDILPLKEITSTIMSGQRPKGGVRNIENGVPSLGGEHVNADGTIKTKGLKYIPFDFHKKYSKTSIKPLDILVVKDGATTGKVGIVPLNFPYNECNINEHVFLIRVKDNIEPYYVFSFLQSAAGRIQIQRKITGAAQTGITKDVVNSLLIPIPLIEIQKEIAGEVRRRRERAKELQEEAEAVIKLAKEKVEKRILGVEK